MGLTLNVTSTKAAVNNIYLPGSAAKSLELKREYRFLKTNNCITLGDGLGKNFRINRALNNGQYDY